jgi:hypothetical protein
MARPVLQIPDGCQVETLEHLLALIPRPLRVVFPATVNFGKAGWKMLHEVQPLPSFDFSAAAKASLPSWEVTSRYASCVNTS